MAKAYLWRGGFSPGLKHNKFEQFRRALAARPDLHQIFGYLDRQSLEPFGDVRGNPDGGPLHRHRFSLVATLLTESTGLSLNSSERLYTLELMA
jgi:hypothetical protein